MPFYNDFSGDSIFLLSHFRHINTIIMLYQFEKCLMELQESPELIIWKVDQLDFSSNSENVGETF